MNGALGGAVLASVSPSELYEVISAAASQDPSRIQASTQRLKEMLQLSGSYDALHEIAAQKSLPLPVRQQSIIQFKNFALMHWKSRKMLTDEQRARIRTRSLMFVEEEDNLVAQCNETIIAKIARQDFPASWPSLTDDILGFVDKSLQIRYSSADADGGATLVLRRSLKILNEILKEFSSFKMLQGVKAMGQIVQQLHLVLSGYYSTISSTLNSTLNPSSIGTSRTADDILLAHLFYKNIVKMAVWLWIKSDWTSRNGFEKLQSWLLEVIQDSILRAKALIELRTNLVLALRSSPADVNAIGRRSLNQLTCHVRLFGKFFRKLQQLSPPRFVALPMCNELVMFYWGNVVQATNGPQELIADSSEAVFPVRFLVQAMVLFKENLAQWTPQRRDGTFNENALPREVVENAVRLLVTQFIPLKPSDLESWMSDPEEWVNLEEQEKDSWEFELRPCSERVLMTLAQQYKQYVTPLLEATFKQVVAQPTVDLPSIVQKEALYCAIGRCATHLKDIIPFEQWLAHTLAAEVRETNTNYPIVKRRIAWLIGKWVSNMCITADNAVIWDILLHLLQDRGPGTDGVVRLTAGVVLRECVESISFDADVFAPYLPSVVTEIMQLIGETDNLDSKRMVLNTLNVVIDQSGRRIFPLTDMIMAPLPLLWTSAGDEWAFKASLLVTMTKLISATKEQSVYMASVVIPLIRESLSSGAITHLDEDALVLWLTALRNTVTIQSVNNAPGLIDLFPLALSLLAVNLDLLGKIIDIIGSYFILDGSRILQLCGIDLFKACFTALNSGAITRNMKDMVTTINLLLQLTPPALWAEALHISGLFAHSLGVILDNQEEMTLLTEHIYVLARIMIADPRIFLQLMAATASSQSKAETVLYEGLLDQWWTLFDSMSESRHRKLSAMGIASLVSTGRPEVLNRLPSEIFNIWLDVFGEIKEAQVDAAISQASTPLSSPRSVKCFWEQDEPPLTYFQGTEGTPEYDRRKNVYDNDPVRASLLSGYVADRLREAEASCGGTENFRNVYLAQVDPTVWKQIKAELIYD